MTTSGRLIVLSGPSGAGKTTVIEILCRTGPFVESVSATTRRPRGNERDGVHYHFLTREQFEERLRQDAFLEHAWVHGEQYGTLRSEVDRIVRSGRHCLLSIDVQGAMQLREQGVRALFLFLAPPDMKTLEERIRRRRENTEEEILRRMRAARAEMEMRVRYDHVIVNRDAEEAAAEVRALADGRTRK